MFDIFVSGTSGMFVIGGCLVSKLTRSS